VSNAADPRTRLAAAKWLAERADREAAERQEALLEELRTMYRRVVAATGVVADGSVAEPRNAGGMSPLGLPRTVAGTFTGLQAFAADGAIAPQDAGDGPQSIAAEPGGAGGDAKSDQNATASYRDVRISPAGHFPARFRREPI
jgi:hypothetical protein